MVQGSTFSRCKPLLFSQKGFLLDLLRIFSITREKNVTIAVIMAALGPPQQFGPLLQEETSLDLLLSVF